MVRISVSRHRSRPGVPVLRGIEVLLIAAAWLALQPPAARAADGLPGGSADPAAGRTDITQGWQARVGRSGIGDANLNAPAVGDGWASRNSLSLFGDYYFGLRGAAPPWAASGGFRATGGLFLGPRSGLGLTPSATGLTSVPRGTGLAITGVPYAPADAPDSSSVPYVGVGYSGLKALRATGGGWAFSADVGLMALQPRSAVRLGQQPLGDTLRDLQLSPLLQLGVSYSF